MGAIAVTLDRCSHGLRFHHGLFVLHQPHWAARLATVKRVGGCAGSVLEKSDATGRFSAGGRISEESSSQQAGGPRKGGPVR